MSHQHNKIPLYVLSYNPNFWVYNYLLKIRLWIESIKMVYYWSSTCFGSKNNFYDYNPSLWTFIEIILKKQFKDLVIFHCMKLTLTKWKEVDYLNTFLKEVDLVIYSLFVLFFSSFFLFLLFFSHPIKKECWLLVTW